MKIPKDKYGIWKTWFVMGVCFPIGLILLVGFGIGLAVLIVTSACNELSLVHGAYTEWHFFQGCYIDHEGVLVPVERWLTITNG